MSDEFRALLAGVQAQDFRSLARLLTWIERSGTLALICPELLKPDRPAFRIGITGPPGAGKSTLIGKLMGQWRQAGLKIGVLAVDPSSPFTRGAILGDRVRYAEHFDPDFTFVRSLGSRGSLGGLSASAYLMLRAFDLVGFDLVIIETVGVGQTELEVVNVADDVAVVLVPESGDSVQAMKAGLLEIANVFVVNKGDRPGADSMVNELKASLLMSPTPSSVEVFQTVAIEAKGIDPLVQRWKTLAQSTNWQRRRNEPLRLKAEGAALLRYQVETEIQARVAAITNVADLERVVRLSLPSFSGQ